MNVEGVASVEVRTISAHSGGSDDVTEDGVPLCGYTSRSFKLCLTISRFVIALRNFGLKNVEIYTQSFGLIRPILRIAK
jgi:hypothetical protein